MSDFSPAVKQDNRDPRVACALLLDTSYSMHGKPIEQLNMGYETLRQDLAEDPLARKRTEVSVITFGGRVSVAVPFTEGRDLQPATFTAGGNTPLGEALELGLDQVLARKQAYKNAGLEYYRPWLFLITDGAPTDGVRFTTAAAHVKEVEAKKGVTVFGVGVENADLDVLAQISNERPPKVLDGLRFIELFQWLSQSMSVVSNSVPGDIYDAVPLDGGGVPTEQNPLPPADAWAKW